MAARQLRVTTGFERISRSSTSRSLRRPVSVVVRRRAEKSVAILLLSRRYAYRTGCEDWP